MNGREGVFKTLLDFLEKLEAAHIYYRLSATTPRAIMVNIDVPGERWEVEFREDGAVEVEVFVSRGDIEGREAIEELFRRFSD